MTKITRKGVNAFYDVIHHMPDGFIDWGDTNYEIFSLLSRYSTSIHTQSEIYCSSESRYESALKKLERLEYLVQQQFTRFLQVNGLDYKDGWKVTVQYDPRGRALFITTPKGYEIAI